MRDGVTLRGPRGEDAAGIWELLGRIEGLERNTAYAYLLLCSHFADTGLVAEKEGRLIGLVLGYRPPSDPDAAFVWQVGVAPEARGAGLGARMLDAWLERPACRDAARVCATVGPDNVASLALFHGLARRHGVPCAVSPGFPSALFPVPHPDEDLLTIGPLPRSAERTS